MTKVLYISRWGLKLALAASFLSAVADRFGFWGSPGTEGIFWGNFDSFTSYTGLLAPWASGTVLGYLAWFVTAIELILGVLLMTNFKTREVALTSALLLFIFGFSMIFTIGPKAPLDYSVFSAAFGAFLLFATTESKSDAIVIRS